MVCLEFPISLVGPKPTFEVVAVSSKVICPACFAMSETNYRLIITDLTFVVFRLFITALTALLLTLLASNITREEFRF